MKYVLSFSLLLCFQVNILAQTFKTHRVEKGETVEAIANTYLVTPLNVYKLNPDAQNGIKEGDLLLLPNDKLSSDTEANVESKKILKGFKKHKTRRKETLFSITQKYNIEEDELKKYNRHLYAQNLRKGDELNIPIFEIEEIRVENELLKKYSVLPKEGKWRVAYKFGITIDELETLNPGLSEILQEGQIINVPNLSAEKPINDLQYSYYTVLPKEGFFRLKQKLNLEQKELEALNPELLSGGLKSGMVIKIPYREDLVSTQTSSLVTSVSKKAIDLKNHINNKELKRIAVLLPFKLNEIKGDSLEQKKDKIENDSYTRTSLDLYTGILTAVDSLKKLGLSIQIDVYDTESSKSKINALLRANNFKNTDAVIGPLTTANFNTVSYALQSDNVPMLAPISNTVELRSNVFQSVPKNAVIEKAILDFVKADTAPKNIIIISDSDQSAKSNMLKREFPLAKQVYSSTNKDGKDMRFMKSETISSSILSGKNYVFLESENAGFISNVAGLLNASVSTTKEIVLLTTNFNSAFESDDVSNYHLSNLNFHYASTSKSYNDERDSKFISAYRDRFGETPNKFAVRGYDLTMDIGLRLAVSNSLYDSVGYSTEYKANKFSYALQSQGYVNNDVYVVRYNNLNIIEVKTNTNQ